MEQLPIDSYMLLCKQKNSISVNQQVQCSNGPPVLGLTSQTSPKENILQTDWPKVSWDHNPK